MPPGADPFFFSDDLNQQVDLIMLANSIDFAFTSFTTSQKFEVDYLGQRVHYLALDLFREVKQRYPDFRLHALSPPEVIHISRLSKLPTNEVLRQLIDAGLNSVPGGGAGSPLTLMTKPRSLRACMAR